MNWKQGFFLESLWDVAPAALINLRLALFAFMLAVLGGTAFTLIRSLKIRPVNALIAVVISFIRGTPLMVQIFLFFYALPAIGIDLGPMTAGVSGIAFNSAVFITEIQRGSLRAIDPGMIEAATALGLRARPIWWKVILPQLFRRILPMLMNEATVVVKGTALLSIITVVEMLRVAQQVGSANFSPFEPLVAAALFFLAINLVLGAGASALERRFATQRA
jgi:polar amino acid transport system permease protein